MCLRIGVEHQPTRLMTTFDLSLSQVEAYEADKFLTVLEDVASRYSEDDLLQSSS